MTDRSAFLEQLRSTVDYPVREEVILGNLTLTVHAATTDFGALRYFAAKPPPLDPAQRSGSAHFYWVPERALPADLLGQAQRLADSSFRAARFRQGFYLTHHYGGPALLFVESDAAVLADVENTRADPALIVVAELNAGVGPMSTAERANLVKRIRRLLSMGFGLSADKVHLIPPRTLPVTPSGKTRRAETWAMLQHHRRDEEREPHWPLPTRRRQIRPPPANGRHRAS